MVKKSSLVLTIIAVATLIISIMGASFAYFSYVSGTSSSSTLISGSLANSGLIGTTGGKTLNMTLTNAHMAYTNINKKFHITDAGISETANAVEIATMTVNGGENNKKYTCQGTVQISLPNDATSNSIINSLRAGEFYVVLSSSNNLVSGLTSDPIDLFTAKTNAITKNFSYTLTSGADATKSTKLKADVYFANTTSSQNVLAGKTFKVNIVVTTTSCTMVL